MIPKTPENSSGISGWEESTDRKSLRRRGRVFDVSILLGVADDYSGALFTEYTSLFGLRAPVPTFLAIEEAEHARGFLCTWSLYKHRALVSHVGP
jgi:hypothetical protein